MSSAFQAGDVCPKCDGKRGRITTSRRIRQPDVDSYDGMDRKPQFATDYSCDHGHSWRETFTPSTASDVHRDGSTR
jgi:hypothetical protein